MRSMDVDDITNFSREEWCTRVLAGYCQAALRFRAAMNGLCVNYNQLPAAVWTALATHCAMAFSVNEVTRMRQVAGFDAQNPARRFQPDAHGKQCEATPRIRALAAGMLMPLYRELESWRGTV